MVQVVVLVKKTANFLLGLAAFAVVVTSGVKAQAPAKFDGSFRIMAEGKIGNIRTSSRLYEAEINSMRGPILANSNGRPTPKTLASAMDSLIFIAGGDSVSKRKDIHLYEAEDLKLIDCDILTFKIVDAARMVGLEAQYLIKSGHFAALARVPGGEWHKLETDDDGHISAVPWVRDAGELATADAKIAMCATYENYGRRAMARGDYEAAKFFLKKAISLAPNASQLYTSMGACLLGQKDTASAFVFFKKAVEISPNNYLTNYNAARLYEWMGDRATALAHANEAYRLNPNTHTLSLKAEIGK